jgi:hypothetical protein
MAEIVLSEAISTASDQHVEDVRHVYMIMINWRGMN